ncbi:hypothetical protein MMC13_004900 [Lambiella insularis]|nr:hypothetical protein [Lambiella insularis]
MRESFDKRLPKAIVEKRKVSTFIDVVQSFYGIEREPSLIVKLKLREATPPPEIESKSPSLILRLKHTKQATQPCEIESEPSHVVKLKLKQATQPPEIESKDPSLIVKLKLRQATQLREIERKDPSLIVKLKLRQATQPRKTEDALSTYLCNTSEDKT